MRSHCGSGDHWQWQSCDCSHCSSANQTPHSTLQQHPGTHLGSVAEESAVQPAHGGRGGELGQVDEGEQGDVEETLLAQPAVPGRQEPA